MYKAYAIISLVMLMAYSNYAFADSENLEIKVLAGSSNEESQIKSFYPEILPINPDDSITWINEDSVTHSITSGIPNNPEHSGVYFKTGSIEPSKSAKVKIEDTWSFAYYYFCEIHPWLTGKIVIVTAPESQPETDNPIATNTESYIKGQNISVIGSVHPDFAKTPYQILVYNESDKLVDVKEGRFDENASYTQTIRTANMIETDYTLKVVYGLPTQVGTATFRLEANHDVKIPTWIKSGAKWWSAGEISDREFVEAIEYLAKENIITIQKTQPSEHSTTIPKWIKTNAAWWADGLISDSEFTRGLQFLVNSGIIQI